MFTIQFSARPLLILLAALASFAPPALAAQADRGTSDDVAKVRAGVASLGRQWNARVQAETMRLYLDLHRQRDSSALKRTAGIAYGPHAQQKLDLFVPDQGFDEPGPVLVFLHDSDGPASDRILRGSEGLLYSNVAKAMARAGGVGINATYRTGAKSLSADGAEDIRRLIEWTRANAAQYGGDPEAIIVLGHGEGAMRLASYLFIQSSQQAGGPGLAGAVLAGGSFDAPELVKLVDDYRGKVVPIQLWSSELDPLESGVAALKDRLCAKDQACPMIAELKGHNRVSAVMSFDSPDMSAMGQLARFYHSVVQK